MARISYKELEAQLRLAERRLHEAQDRLDKIESSRDEDVEDEGPRNDFLTTQLDLLADEIRFGSLNASPEQMSRLLRGIAKGDDWRHGTWK